MNRTPPSHRPTPTRWERGQVLPLVAIVMVVVAGLLMVGMRVGAVLDASARARTAADAAALAGAAAGETEARALARANGGELIEYVEVGGTVMVVVRVGPATSEAWAEATVRWVRTGPG